MCCIANGAKLRFASVFNVSINNDDQIELFEFSILSEDLLQKIVFEEIVRITLDLHFQDKLQMSVTPKSRNKTQNKN